MKMMRTCHKAKQGEGLTGTLWDPNTHKRVVKYIQKEYRSNKSGVGPDVDNIMRKLEPCVCYLCAFLNLKATLAPCWMLVLSRTSFSQAIHCCFLSLISLN
jgi:hypothetical protein